MSKTLQQIFVTNPTTVVADTDLYYLVQSPYTPGTDAAITGASLKAAFGSGGTINPGLADQLAYYASSGTTLSGLATLANGTLITSPTGVPSISQTLPNAVQDNIARLGTITSIGAPLGGAFGGTGVNNGVRTATYAGNLNFASSFTTSGAFAVTQTYTGATNVTFPTSGTLATTSQLLISPLTTKGDIWVWSTTNDRLPVGTINGQVLQVNSGATTGLSYSTATYPSTATNAARILRSDGTNWVQTTSTFADTYAASSILYANGANNVAGLTTANNGLLVTSNTGVPSILAGPGTTGNILQSNAAVAPSFSTATFPSVATSTGSFLYANGTNWVASTSLWPNTVGSSGKVVISNGTTNVYSTPTFPNASATTGKIIISDGTNWIASTPTYPASAGASGDVLTSDGTNWLSSTPAASGAFKTIAIQRITATGAFTYTATSGTTFAIFEIVGAGGGSGGTTGAAGQQAVGGAGAAGSYLKFLVTGTSNLAAVSGSVGTGGTAGSSGNNNGGAGGATTVTVNAGTTWTAAGGGFGAGMASNAAPMGGGTAGASSANTVGTNGTLISNIQGQNGILGFSNGASFSGTPGVGGSSVLGSGGRSNQNGIGPGGGAGGFLNFSGANAAGQTGANGIVIVTEFSST